MLNTHTFRKLSTTFLSLLLAAMLLLSAAPPAHAHAELRQSSPEAGETVGGPIHSIALQFIDLDLEQVQQAEVFDAAGNALESQLNQEDQRLVIALVNPIATEGQYFVSYAVFGLDGDFTQENFAFNWREGAPAPSGITVDAEPSGFDITGFVLLLIGAAVAAFIVNRFIVAYREHRAAQATRAT